MGMKDKALESLGVLKDQMGGMMHGRTMELMGIIMTPPPADSGEEVMDVTLFSTEGRLCSIFSPLLLELENGCKVSSFLSFCLPFIPPPELDIKPDLAILSELSVTFYTLQYSKYY